MALCYAVGSLPSVLVWNLWAHVHRSRLADILYYTDYLGFHLHTVSFRDIPRLILVNLRHLVCSAGGLIVFNLYDKTYERFLGAILGLIAIAALIGLARHSGLRQYHLFALAYGLVLILWNLPPRIRRLHSLANSPRIAFNSGSFVTPVIAPISGSVTTLHGSRGFWRTTTPACIWRPAIMHNVSFSQCFLSTRATGHPLRTRFAILRRSRARTNFRIISRPVQTIDGENYFRRNAAHWNEP